MLVSAIMPTMNRRHLVSVAVKSFLSQDWPEKELVIIDDGKDSIGDLCEKLPGVNYAFSAGNFNPPRRIGYKLNLACDKAAGDILIRFDDDDWSAPNRITDQVSRLVDSGKSVSGYHSMLFWDSERKQASKYNGANNYSLGTALCFTRDYWKRNNFPNSSIGEDNEFIKPAKRDGDIVSVDADQRMVARIHDCNTSNKTGPLKWPPVAESDIPSAFFEAIQ